MGRTVPPVPQQATCVLGKNTLGEVREDMDRLCLPSWIGRGPKQPGEAKQGRLKADEWRTLCMVNLPITLVRLWGQDKGRSGDVLNNYMHLVQAVKIASQRQISAQDIKNYQYHMHSYLESLLKLYLGTTITPYQHISLHFGEHLRRWGPVHSWRCFAFERFNGMLQNITTNCKFGKNLLTVIPSSADFLQGDLEHTLFLTFTKGQRLRALFHSSHLPPLIQSLVDRLSASHDSAIRSTFMQDNLVADHSTSQAVPIHSKTLVDRDFDLLKAIVRKMDKRSTHIPNSVHNLPMIQRQGETYSGPKKTEGNSLIIFKLAGRRHPGQIQSVFNHTRTRNNGKTVTESFVLVRPFLPLSEEDAKQDIYRTFPSGGMLFRDTLGECVLIQLAAVVCHFARTQNVPIGTTSSCIHVLPLMR